MTDPEREVPALSLQTPHEAAEEAIRKWYEINEHRARLIEENTALREERTKQDIEIREMNSQLSLLRSELEHYRLRAIAAGEQLRNIRAIVNEACIQWANQPSTNLSPGDEATLKDLATRLAPQPYQPEKDSQ